MTGTVTESADLGLWPDAAAASSNDRVRAVASLRPLGDGL